MDEDGILGDFRGRLRRRLSDGPGTARAQTRRGARSSTTTGRGPPPIRILRPSVTQTHTSWPCLAG